MPVSLRIFAVTSFVLALSACATPPRTAVFDRSSTFSVSKDTAWERVILFFTDNNIQVKTIEKDSGVIYAERASFDNSYADCGVVPLTIEESRSATLNVFVRPIGSGRTQVTVNSDYKITRRFDNKVFVDECKSTGLLERGILETVRTGRIN